MRGARELVQMEDGWEKGKEGQLSMTRASLLYSPNIAMEVVDTDSRLHRVHTDIPVPNEPITLGML